MQKHYFSPLLRLLLVSQTSIAQDHSERTSTLFGAKQIFGLLEMPFLIIALIFSFPNATRLKGGKFGSGMTILAWGFVVMAVGHLHMQIVHIFNHNIFQNVFNNSIGNYIWFIALVFTWGLSALGFNKIYRASNT